jgi:protein TonB
LDDLIDRLFSNFSGYHPYKEYIGKALHRPKLVHSEAPEYPSWARDQKLQADLALAARVDTGGNVMEVRVLESTDARFNAAAIQALAKWKFTPGTANGVPETFVMVIPSVSP